MKAFSNFEISCFQIKLWVFPEGTRSQRPNLLPFKKGAFHLANQGKIPIIPIVISSYNNFLDSKNKRWEAGNVHIKILPAVLVDKELSNEGVAELTERVRADMQSAFTQISNFPPIPDTSSTNKQYLKNEGSIN
jgi:lysophosphatidate acyltransferase